MCVCLCVPDCTMVNADGFFFFGRPGLGNAPNTEKSVCVNERERDGESKRTHQSSSGSPLTKQSSSGSEYGKIYFSQFCTKVCTMMMMMMVRLRRVRTGGGVRRV